MDGGAVEDAAGGTADCDTAEVMLSDETTLCSGRARLHAVGSATSAIPNVTSVLVRAPNTPAGVSRGWSRFPRRSFRGVRNVPTLEPSFFRGGDSFLRAWAVRSGHREFVDACQGDLKPNRVGSCRRRRSRRWDLGKHSDSNLAWCPNECPHRGSESHRSRTRCIESRTCEQSFHRGGQVTAARRRNSQDSRYV